MPKRDLIGQKFGSLTIISEAGRSKSGDVLWKCKCDCGKETTPTGSNLTSGKAKSCGHCYSNNFSLSDDGSHVIMSFPNGTEFRIDLDDYARVSAHTWHRTGRGYAGAYIDGIYVRLHRFIMNAPINLQVDHINLDKSDNRKSNLRLATHKENKRNVGLQSNNTSGLKGVRYYKPRNKYVARIKVDGKDIHLGYFASVIEAAQAYNRAALRFFGEFARLNDLREITPEPVSFLLSRNEQVQPTLDSVTG